LLSALSARTKIQFPDACGAKRRLASAWAARSSAIAELACGSPREAVLLEFHLRIKKSDSAGWGVTRGIG